MSNKHRTVLYIGVTSNLLKRVYQHKNLEGSKFTSKYRCTDLIYFECFEGIEEAISREKYLKKWNRKWKDELIRKINPGLKDISEEIQEYV